MPLLLALHGPSQHEIREELSKKQPATPELVRMLIDQFAIGKTIDVARHYNAQAVKALPPLGGKQSSALANFPEAYLTWCLEHSVASEYDL
jgi:geranylgeranyl pyrophosphate synthase